MQTYVKWQFAINLVIIITRAYCRVAYPIISNAVFLKHDTQMTAILFKKLCAIQYKVNIQCILRFNLYILPNMEI